MNNTKLTKEVVRIWNEFARKKAENDNINIESAVYLVCREIGYEEFIDAMMNYKQALELPRSQAWDFNLWAFATRGYRKFLPGIFDIDNYNMDNFRPKTEMDTKNKVNEAMKYGELF